MKCNSYIYGLKLHCLSVTNQFIMIQKIIPLSLYIFLSSNLFAQVEIANDYDIKITKQVGCTPIKSQDNTGTCWSFSTASFIESEVLRKNKGEHDLSEMFVVRQIYVEKALNYVRRQGKAQFSQGSLSHDVTNIIKKFGIVPEAVFSGKLSANDKHDHSEMERILKAIVDAAIKGKKLSQNWLKAYEAVLDVYLGKVPKNFEYKGRNYTPKTFAADFLGINPSDYVEITSYEHHPFYETCILEIPDNFSNGIYYNVPIKDLETITDNAIQQGYSVAWDCDVSEKGFSSQEGLAILPKEITDEKAIFKTPQKEQKVSQRDRQLTFDSYATTDDHLMHITGIAKDKNGTKYYLVKNSWGERGPLKGYLYASEAYFQLKTIAIMVHKKAIPKNIAQKLAF